MSPTAEAETAARAREAVAANPHWYHTLELANDWDIRLGRGFRLASEALGSAVRRLYASLRARRPS
jgi:hypothetical protein